MCQHLDAPDLVGGLPSLKPSSLGKLAELFGVYKSGAALKPSFPRKRESIRL